MADGFLSRWSRRKAGIEDEVAEQQKEATQPLAQTNAEMKAPDPEVPPPPTLDDVEKIDRFAPDFSAFMKPDVDPAVQQAALKKMFTDPHFNVMDGLDIYIDDYSRPDPLPPGMLERMVQSDMLNLFKKSGDEADQKEGPAGITKAAEPDQATLEAPTQSDLTSTQIQAQEKSASLDEMPLASDQKKT